MMTEKYNTQKLKIFLKKNKISNISDLKRVLGTSSRNTVLRKLNVLGYTTSYSHNGSYYVLNSVCKFNSNGLWFYKKICFSSFGTLLNTTKDFVESSDSGMAVSELDKILFVSTKLALMKLNKEGELYREKYGGVFIYFSNQKRNQKRQIILRIEDRNSVYESIEDDMLAHEIKAALILFFTLLNEQQRRVFAGLESIKIGKGGDARVANILGIDPHTIAKGRRELLDGELDMNNVRKKGGGRKKLEKKLQK